jgi:hypothetical protein
MVRCALQLALLAVLLSASGSAVAFQSLIPEPYPNAAPGAQPLDPELPHLHGPQRILRDPYPQLLGSNAQGNPPLVGRRRHQHLVPSINERKYGVDRLPQYYD